MRVSLLVLLTLLGLAGCRTGYLADRLVDRPEIIAPQLTRYGFTAEQTRCVSTGLASRLSYADLRSFELRARALRRGLINPGQITPRDLLIVADGAQERQIPLELRHVATGCGMDISAVAIASAQAGAPAATASVTVPPADTALPTSTPTWLNLGSAPSGQSISVDATSVQQEGATRLAWFRMTDPETGQATLNSYRLRIDCTNRMYAPLAWRRYDDSGAVVDSRDYSADVAPAQEVEGGTVTEIAFLSLCT